jgi:hypothetical protein
LLIRFSQTQVGHFSGSYTRRRKVSRTYLLAVAEHSFHYPKQVYFVFLVQEAFESAELIAKVMENPLQGEGEGQGRSIYRSLSGNPIVTFNLNGVPAKRRIIHREPRTPFVADYIQISDDDDDEQTATLNLSQDPIRAPQRVKRKRSASIHSDRRSFPNDPRTAEQAIQRPRMDIDAELERIQKDSSTV